MNWVLRTILCIYSQNRIGSLQSSNWFAVEPYRELQLEGNLENEWVLSVEKQMHPRSKNTDKFLQIWLHQSLSEKFDVCKTIVKTSNHEYFIFFNDRRDKFFIRRVHCRLSIMLPKQDTLNKLTISTEIQNRNDYSSFSSRKGSFFLFWTRSNRISGSICWLSPRCALVRSAIGPR